MTGTQKTTRETDRAITKPKPVMHPYLQDLFCITLTGEKWAHVLACLTTISDGMVQPGTPVKRALDDIYNESVAQLNQQIENPEYSQ
jgi:hypothetical protein